MILRAGKHPFFLPLLAMLVCGLLLAQPAAAQDDTPADNLLAGSAYILDVTYEAQQAALLVKGELGDSCTVLGPSEQSVSESDITITIPTLRPADAMCAMMLASFETRIPLDTSVLAPGDYLVSVNGTSITISLEEEALAALEPVSCEDLEPQPGQEKFENEIFCFLYPEGFFAVASSTLVLLSSDETFDGQRVSMVVETAPADPDQTLTALTTALAAQASQEPGAALPSFETARLGGQIAMLSGSIEEAPVRYIYALTGQQSVTISVQPLAQAAPQTQESAAALWELLLASWGFVGD